MSEERRDEEIAIVDCEGSMMMKKLPQQNYDESNDMLTFIFKHKKSMYQWYVFNTLKIPSAHAARNL